MSHASPVAENTAPASTTAGPCLNCGATLTGPFCAECGQRDIPPYPSTRELVEEAVAELSGWDGRLVKTLRTLIISPGTLTLEFLEGRRARYISPLKLYLTASVVYFLLAAAGPGVRFTSRDASDAGLGVATGVTGDSADTKVVGGRGNPDDGPITPEQKQQALKKIATAPPALRPLLRRSLNDRSGFKRAIRDNVPRLLFVLLPLFAAIVGMFYRHRKYPEHLYFAIHLFAFVFVALSLSNLSKFTLPGIEAVVGSIVFIAIPVYSTLAFRKVYGGSVIGTIAKEIAIAVIYGIVATIAFVALIYWVSLAG